MKNKKDIYAYSFCIALALAVIGMCLRMQQFESKLFPMIISALIIIFGVKGIIGAKRVSARAATAEGGTEPSESLKTWFYNYGAVCILLFCYFLTIYVIGFMIATPLFIVAYTKLRGMKWSVSIGFCAAMTAFQYGIFMLAMKINLYPGILFE